MTVGNALGSIPKLKLKIVTAVWQQIDRVFESDSPVPMLKMMALLIASLVAATTVLATIVPHDQQMHVIECVLGALVLFMVIPPWEITSIDA